MAADPRFFAATGPHSLARLAELTGASPAGDAARVFTGVAPLQVAGPGEVSFLDNRRFLPALKESKAGAVVIAPAHADAVPEGMAALITKGVYLAYARIAGLFHPQPALRAEIHPTAVVSPEAAIGEGSQIGPYAVIEAGVELGPRALVGPHAVIGAGCKFGADCRILAHVTVSHTIAGDRVTLHPGARVGQEGFSFAPTPEGRYVTMPQLGRVMLGDEVEIGANACVDRGSGHDTVLGTGTRLDNLVQIGHNVTAGRGVVLVSQVGVAGSTVIGDYANLAGQAGVAGHVTIGAKARVGAQSGVMSDVPPGIDVFGSPAQPAKEAFRAIARLRRLGEKDGSKQS
ncbi:UDP-3-O-(3-hydroxymyristoyl)glucosamine N-acyltransferase [Acetobacteraceae bacterium H6797]|nr:UDP-3-O-(3-hydroxymyristoyl)glucosamine N-acyltransferase [Acetobacteraceae bacterium H6797]